MSTITYIRHGQASLFSADYDNLSETGWQQAKLLGNYFAEHHHQVDKIFLGPLKRHRQTLEGIQKGMAAKGKSLDLEPTLLEGLKEHKLPEILRLVTPQLIESNAEIKEIAKQPTPTALEKKKVHFRLFEKVFLMWANGELEGLYNGYHSFKEFRAEANDALEQIKKETKKGESVIAVTSGGPVGATVGDTLDLPIKKMCEVSWEVLNSSFTTYKLTKNNFRLIGFNATPHLVDSKLRTLV